MNKELNEEITRICVDPTLIAHTSNPQYERMSKKDMEIMESLRDRTIKIDIPYLLEWQKEIEKRTRMFKVEKSERDELEEKLNALEGEGWEIFAVIPTLDFVNTKIVMGISAPLPQNVEYDIIAKKENNDG